MAFEDLERLTRTPEGVTTFIERPDGTRLHCIAAGEGTVVVLAHGIFNELRCFNLVLEQLLNRHVRIILFDQRGHGQSSIGHDGLGSRQMAGDYKAVLEHLMLQTAYWSDTRWGLFWPWYWLKTIQRWWRHAR